MGVIAVDFDEDVVLDTSPFSVGGPEDLTEEPGEGYPEAEKRFDMSRALVDGFVGLQLMWWDLIEDMSKISSRAASAGTAGDKFPKGTKKSLC